MSFTVGGFREFCLWWHICVAITLLGGTSGEVTVAALVRLTIQCLSNLKHVFADFSLYPLSEQWYELLWAYMVDVWDFPTPAGLDQEDERSVCAQFRAFFRSKGTDQLEGSWIH